MDGGFGFKWDETPTLLPDENDDCCGAPVPLFGPTKWWVSTDKLALKWIKSDFVHSLHIANVGMPVVANTRSPSRRRQQGTWRKTAATVTAAS